MIDIVVVDDHQLVRTGIKRMLADVNGIRVVGEASNGEEALQLVKQAMPQLVLMDLKMPGLNGLDTTRKLLRAYPDLKIIVITASENDIFPIRLMQAGASGYLTKGTSLDEMIRAIRTVQSGQRHIDINIAKKLALRSVSGNQQTPFDDLSERELQIAMMITQGDKVAEIAKKLHLSPKTVNSYRYRIFDKLGIRGDVELTHMTIRAGLMESDIGES